MKALAVLLLVGLFMRHGSAGWIADLTNFPVKGIFYILGGYWEAILCAVILGFIALQDDGLWSRLAVLACLAGILEGLQMSICRTLTADISKVPEGVSLCANLTGLPLGLALFVCYFIAALWIVGKHARPA